MHGYDLIKLVLPKNPKKKNLQKSCKVIKICWVFFCTSTTRFDKNINSRTKTTLTKHFSTMKKIINLDFLRQKKKRKRSFNQFDIEVETETKKHMRI